jgi:hypothetical protein
VSQTDTNRTLLFFLFHMKMVLYHMKKVCFHMKMSRFEVVLLKGDLSIGDSWKRLRVHIDPSSGFDPNGCDCNASRNATAKFTVIP